MKKLVISSVMATTVLLAAGVSSSAAANNGLQAENKITIVDSKNNVTAEPMKLKALYQTAKAVGKAVWSSIPAMDRFSLGQALIGGKVIKDNSNEVNQKDLEKMFDK